jgi:Fe-S cluster assembly protein SufD
MKTVLVETKEKTNFDLEEDSQLVLSFDDFSPQKSYQVTLNFKKPGLNGEIIALFRLKEGQDLDLTTIANHLAPHTQCKTTVRGVLEDKSSANYVGKIIINKEAQQTVSYLEDNVLLVGENIKNESRPILEIEADDVKASHGATTGRISPEEIYYLQTRGLSKNEAEKVIVEGFFESLLNRIKDEKIREKVKKKLYV